MHNDAHWGGWGDVPVDGDVRPFTSFSPYRNGEGRNNKRHHYASVVYLKGFLDEHERVWAYRAEDPASPLHVPPTSIGYEKFYYSQKLPDGSQENHRFEDLWNTVETVWPETMEAITNRRLSPAISINLLGMTAIMRTRVPAARERNEVLIASKIRAEAQTLERLGVLPQELELYAGELDTVPIGVNPQQMLLVFRSDLRGFGDLCCRMGFEVFHNRSDLPFIASDNPVCVYDPWQPVHLRRPYEYDRDVELIFPLDSRTLLRGHNRLKPVNQVVRHRWLSDRAAIRRLNETIAQFGYRMLVASDRSSDDLAVRYADVSPTVQTEVHHTPEKVRIVWRNAFGRRPNLSQFIDTPEKAAKLEARMGTNRVEAKFGAVDSTSIRSGKCRNG